MRLHIDDMTCGGCVRSVTKAIQTLDPTARVDADLTTRHVEVESSASRDQILAALQTAGFTPQPG